MKAGRIAAALSTPEDKRRYTRAVFARIADRYDLANVLLSFNRDQSWKRRLVRLAAVRPGEKVLDLACGTGDIALRLAGAGAQVTGLDITPRMIELARAKANARVRCAPRGSGSGLRAPGSSLSFVIGDMMTLPFPAGSFDVVTTGYGLRNVPEMTGALCEIRRVLKPGGRIFSLDFTRPANRMISAAYLAYLTVVGSAFGWVLHGDPDTYRYIAETVRVHPGAAAFAATMQSAGFEHVASRPVFGGFVALHSGVRQDRELAPGPSLSQGPSLRGPLRSRVAG